MERNARTTTVAILFLLAILATVLAACNGKNDETSTPPQLEETTSEATIETTEETTTPGETETTKPEETVPAENTVEDEDAVSPERPSESVLPASGGASGIPAPEENSGPSSYVMSQEDIDAQERAWSTPLYPPVPAPKGLDPQCAAETECRSDRAFRGLSPEEQKAVQDAGGRPKDIDLFGRLNEAKARMDADRARRDAEREEKRAALCEKYDGKC